MQVLIITDNGDMTALHLTTTEAEQVANTLIEAGETNSVLSNVGAKFNPHGTYSTENCLYRNTRGEMVRPDGSLVE